MQTDKKIITGNGYRASLPGRNLTVFMLGQRVPERQNTPLSGPRSMP